MFGSAKKFLLIGFILVLLAAIPLTVFFLQEQQRTQSQAAKASNLTFVRTSTTPIKVGDEFDVQVRLDPGTNQVIASKLVITYDATKLDKGTSASCSFSGVAATSALCPDAQAFTNVLEGPTFTSGQMSITLTVGVDITKAILATKPIATLKFKALTVGTTQLAFGAATNITSAADPETNVLLPTVPFDLTIGAATAPSATPATTTAPTAAPTAAAATATPAGTGPTTIVTATKTPTPTSTVSGTLTPTTLATATPTKVLTTIAPPGPGNTILTIGSLGAIISIIGGLLFFSL